MNHKRVLDELISRAVNRTTDEIGDKYMEIHHIVPQSLGGGNEKRNLTKLTAREHYIAHALLFKLTQKIYIKAPTIKNKKNATSMAKAFLIMNKGNKNQNRLYNSKSFELLREEANSFSKKYNKEQLKEMFEYYVEFECGKNAKSYKNFQNLYNYPYDKEAAKCLFNSNDLLVKNTNNKYRNSKHDEVVLKNMFDYYVISAYGAIKKSYESLQEKFKYYSTKKTLGSSFNNNDLRISNFIDKSGKIIGNIDNNGCKKITYNPPEIFIEMPEIIDNKVGIIVDSYSLEQNKIMKDYNDNKTNHNRIRL